MKVKVIDKGVCILVQLNTQGVFAVTSLGNFWVSRANPGQHDNNCIEIDVDSISVADGYPKGHFQARVRERKPRRSGGFHMGDYVTGDWIDGALFIAKSPNVLKMFTKWAEKSR